MKRVLFMLVIVSVGGLMGSWLLTSRHMEQATAAPQPGVVTPALESALTTRGVDGSAMHLVEGGRAVPGAPRVIPVAPRAVLLPKFLAEAALPADLLRSQKMSMTPSPLQSFPDTLEGRIGKLRAFSLTNALPPPQSPPPELQMLWRAMSPPNSPPRQTPTVKQLREYLIAEPGGREMLEEAKRRGLRISHLPPDNESNLSAVARLLAPAPAEAADPFKAVYTAKDPKSSVLTFTGIWQFDPFKPVLDGGIHYGGPLPQKSWLVFNVNVPREGMYYVTVTAFGMNVKATLVKGNAIVKLFDYGPGSAFYDYWSLVHLAQGSHTFYWYVERGMAEFREVSVQEET